MTQASTLRAVRALEKAADEIMRSGDPRIAVEAYSAALRLRLELGLLPIEETSDAVT